MQALNTQNRQYYGADQRPPYYQQQNPYRSLQERAQNDGITLYTAGNANMYNPYNQPAPERETALSAPTQPTKPGFYNVGATLFKAAFIMLCILAFESLVVYFTLDYLRLPGYYPAIAFGVGFIAFIICAILHARGYRSNVRRKKHPSYILTNIVIFIICVIITTMVAVYLKAELSDPAQLFSYVIIPIAYLSNILVFTAFYYTFSKYNKN